jgi:ankyrin repeat protein
MAAAAFRRPVAELLVIHGANCRERNRRGAEPLHYAADANHGNPTAQAETIEYLISVGGDPEAVDNSGVAPLHRAVRTRSLAAVRALLDGGATPTDRDGKGKQVSEAATSEWIRRLLKDKTPYRKANHEDAKITTKS